LQEKELQDKRFFVAETRFHLQHHLSSGR